MHKSYEFLCNLLEHKFKCYADVSTHNPEWFNGVDTLIIVSCEKEPLGGYVVGKKAIFDEL